MNQSLFDEVVGCIQKACEGAVGEVHLESRLREDLGMDSLNLVLLQVELESVFGFTFDPLEEDLPNCWVCVQLCEGQNRCVTITAESIRSCAVSWRRSIREERRFQEGI